VIRPRIGVVGRRFPPGSPFPLEASVAVPSAYLDAVERAGGTALVLCPGPDPSSVLSQVQGIVLPGGADVDPRRYGQQPHPTVYGVDPAQDEFEAALLTASITVGTPALCICRGIQLLNVCLGGTLHQHITETPGWGPHGIPNGGGGTDHGIEIAPRSRLAQIVGATRITGRCHHHQALDRLGTGVEAVAWAADGGIEAVEITEVDTVVAVQWHPEETAAVDPANQALFDALVARAASG
jgi:putative glutamine amidotransferase